jgi:hypothetical protein
MLQDISDRLMKVIEQKKHKEKLQADLRSVERELKDETARLDTLRQQLEKEQYDVEKLKGVSVTGLFYSVLGSREQQEEKERQEMLAAQMKYQQAEHQVEFLKRDRDYLGGQLDALAGVEAEYQSLLEEKESLLRQSDQSFDRDLLDLSEQIAEQEAEIKEIGEAIEAGEQVITGLNGVIDSLESAGNWGVWDMLGGELISTAIKHSRIDEARSGIHDVQAQMSRFTRELADVRKHVAIEIDISGLASFADFFFDGLIVDWVVQSRISDSLRQTREAKNMISETVAQLKDLRKSAREQRDELQTRRVRIIEQS